MIPIYVALAILAGFILFLIYVVADYKLRIKSLESRLLDQDKILERQADSLRSLNSKLAQLGSDMGMKWEPYCEGARWKKVIKLGDAVPEGLEK